MSGNPAEASPLQDIERRVQARAKDTPLDMAGAGGKAKLRALIAEEVSAWSDAYNAGSGRSTSPTRIWSPSGPTATWPATALSNPRQPRAARPPRTEGAGS